MDVLIDEQILLSPKDTKTNRVIKFDCKKEYNYIKIHFEYSPRALEDERLCKPKIQRALDVYFEGYDENIIEKQIMDYSKYMPIKNLLTLSIDENGKYLGNAHCLDALQSHLISRNNSTRGFNPCQQVLGNWQIVLHCHEIATETCDVRLIVRGGSLCGRR